ncbi:MAG: carbohydrate ABC transporter permease [Candidatus Fimimorpha sp.]
MKKYGKTRNVRRYKSYGMKIVLTIMAGSIACLFLMPMVITVVNSFMTEQEIQTNYGMIFSEKNGRFISETVNLKLIPDWVSLEQYFTVLMKSPDYLMKLWNSLFLVVPIVIFQLIVGCLAAYGFANMRGKGIAMIFFGYIVLMLMPYQVTLVPNYLVAKWMNLIDTNWAIWFPGIFAPFSVYLLTKYMKRIPWEIVEAAEMDGAGQWQIFYHIVVPVCKGAIASCAILIFIDYWNMVEQAVVMFSNANFHPLSVFLSKIQTEDIGIAFAAAVVYMLPVTLIFLYGEDYLIDGIASQGSIK